MTIVGSVLLLVGLFVLLGVAWRNKGRPACSTKDDEQTAPGCDACPIAPKPLEETARPKIDWWSRPR